MMEYQTSSATLSRKYSNAHNLSSKSAYDGVFSAPSSKLGAPSFSSRVQDYSEIFSGSKASSIPFLDVPELNGRNVSVDVRNPKLDYSTVFGDFGGLDFAVSYDEIFSEPKKGNEFSGKPRSPAERANRSEEADHSDCSEKKQMHSREASYESFDAVKKSNMSYNKINQGVKNIPNGTNGTTHIAELRAVPGFTCLIDEITPLHSSGSNKPVPSAVNDTYLNKNFTEGVTEGVQSTKVVADLPAVGSSKKKSKSGVVLRNKSDHYRSNSVDVLFGAYEYGKGHSEEGLPSSRPLPNLYNSKGDSESSMASKFGVSGSGYAGSGLASSPPYFVEEVDANSFAAASVAALKKAIEEAEVSMKIAKQSMARKKEGLQDRVKLSSNNGWKDEQRGEGKVTDNTNKSKGKGISEINEEEDAPLHVSAGMREQNVMRAAHLTPPFGVGEKTFATKAALGETFGTELRSPPVDHRQKEAGVCNAVDRENKSKENRDLEKCQKEDGPVQVSADMRQQDGIRTDHVALDFGIREKSVGTKAALGESCEEELRSTQVDHRQNVAEVWDAVDKANRPKEKEDLEICEKEEVPVQFSSGVREQNEMRASNLTSDFGGGDKPSGSKSASGETCERELKSTQADFRQVAAEVWEAVQQFCGLAKTGKDKVTMSGFEWPDNLKKECCEKPEECGERSNAVKEAHKQDEVERKINVVEGAVISEENEVEFKSSQQLHDQEGNEKKSSVFWEQEESEKKGIHGQEICEATLEDFQEPMNYTGNIETQGFDKKGDMNWQMGAQEWVEDDKKVKESCEEDGTNEEQEGAHNGEETKMWLDRVHKHPRIEMQFNDFHDQEENENSLKDSSDLEGIETLQEAGENEKLLRGSACQTEEKVKSQKETCESIEAEKVQLEIDQSAEDVKKFEVVQEDLNYGINLEMANERYNQDESGSPNKNQEPSRHIEDDEDVELILEVAECEKNVSIMEVNKESIKQEENGIELEPVKDEETVKVAEEALYHENNLDAADDICELEEGENQSENWEASRYGEDEEDVDLVLEVDKENGSRVEPDKASIKQEENGMELEIYKDDKMVKVAEEAPYNENDVETTDDACKLDEKENLSEKQESGRHREGGKYVEVTLEVSSDEENMSTMRENTASFEHKENEQDSEAVAVANDMEDKEIHETVRFPQDTFKLGETKHQMEDTIETIAFDLDGVNSIETEMSFGQKQNEHAEHKKMCNLESSIEELDPEWEKIYENVKGVGIAADKEEDQNYSMSSHKERWVDDGNQVKAAQLPSMSEGESGSAETTEEIKITQTTENHKENHQSAETMEQKGSNDTPQEEVELEKRQFKRIDDVKKREREREREKLAVERAIREARERAFAEAREKAEWAAAEKASAEARRRREKLGKTPAEANEKASVEKAAMEAKLKAERAAVERATAEARERALERAMSEKFSGASKDDGRKQSFSTHDQQHKGSCRPGNSTYPSSSSHVGMSNVPHSTERFDGANGESAQRCKARSERHQRIVERAAKALAEKNMRDLLAQKEQAERNRLAETLDGDVKRWSSGKEGNLRALLSTLQYILGPDCGWQPIPLTDIITTSAVKKAYRKATLYVHPDKLQQRGASIQQKYTCEKVFDLLKEAWNRFNVEER